MSDIYQQIWDADQGSHGVRPILDTDVGNPETGYVKVNAQLDSNHRELRVLPEVVIPTSKRRTYDLTRHLFDNFALRERDEEDETAAEREEIHDLVHAMVDTPPMDLARDFVAAATGTSLSRERWYNTILEMWFRRFSMGGDPHLTGFEHVVVGEQEGAKAQGYHFWYKYHLDDGFARQTDGFNDFPGLSDDRITYLGSKLAENQVQFPETVTISYKWDAPDYERGEIRPLTKPVGGFFVGCSVEGLLALGTVRAHLGANAPKEAIINGARYSMKLYHSHDRHHVRTFYPKFHGPASPPGTGDGGGGGGDTVTVSSGMGVRIVAALINPEGDDPGSEAVTLINTTPRAQSLSGWRITDRNGNSMELPGHSLDAGDALRVVLRPNTAQLSNKGGLIDLVDAQANRVHRVTYSKAQARADGHTILF